MADIWDPEQLWLKAKAYADKAHDAKHGSPDFPFWCALSLELLARAALTNIHPALNADPREDISLLAACGFDVAGQPKSLPVHAVFLRLEKTIPGFGKPQRDVCGFLSHLRNQELHSGELPFVNLKDSKWLPRYYDACDVLSRALGKSLRDFFGSELASSAEKLIRTLESEIKKAVRDQLIAHGKVFHGKSEDERAKLSIKAAAAVTRLPHGTAMHSCPACKTPGALKGDLIKESAPVYEDDVLVVSQEYLAETFRCFACELTLRNIEEITAAGIEPRFEQQAQIELHDLHEPDYYDEYDNM